MKVSLPNSNEVITTEVSTKSWYTFFSNLYDRVSGFFDGSLSLALKDTAQEGNSGGTETSISNQLFKIDRLRTNTVLDVFIYGTRAANGNNKTIKLKLNSTTIYSSTVATSGGIWELHAKIINLGTSQKIYLDDGSLSSTTSAINTTTTDIDVILTLQGTATNDIVKEYFEVSYNA